MRGVSGVAWIRKPERKEQSRRIWAGAWLWALLVALLLPLWLVAEAQAVGSHKRDRNDYDRNDRDRPAAMAVPAPDVPAPETRPPSFRNSGNNTGTGSGAKTSTSTSASRAITLTMTKAQRIDLPVDARDVLVANPEVADVVVKTPRQVFVTGKAVGDTNAFFLDESGKQVLSLDIHVEMDLRGVRDALHALAPASKVTVRAAGNNVAITGSVTSATEAENVRQIVRRFVPSDQHIVNLMKISGSQQVVIRVRVAEMRRTVAKKLGFNLLWEDGSFRIFTGQGDRSGQFFDSHGSLQRLGRGPFGINNLTTVIEGLEQEGLVKTLAEPNLTALSGESANFLVGGEFPIPVSSTNNNGQNALGIEFKPFGVGLNFTPVVLDHGRISMRISTEVSELSQDGAIRVDSITIPALAVRRTNTTVEIPSGGALVLAGLLKNNVLDDINAFPGLSAVPVLGALFRSPQFRRDETELVIVATPFVVGPTSPDQISLPTDGFTPASDLDLFLHGRLYSRYGATGRPAHKPSGERASGYIME